MRLREYFFEERRWFREIDRMVDERILTSPYRMAGKLQNNAEIVLFQ
jgi:hypothetical protein